MTARYRLRMAGPQGRRHTLLWQPSDASLLWEDGSAVDLRPVGLHHQPPGSFAAAFPVSPSTPAGKAAAPRVLKIQLGLKCNYACQYCNQAAQPQDLQGDPRDVRDDAVQHDGSAYICIADVANTASPDTDATHWTLLDMRIERFVPDTYCDAHIVQSSDLPKRTWNGLEHLEGREVVMVADGQPHERQVVQDGAITLARAARAVEIGLPYSHEIRPLPPELGNGAITSQGGPARLVRAIFRLHLAKALSVDVGRGLRQLPFSRGGDSLDMPPTAFSGDIEVAHPWRFATQQANLPRLNQEPAGDYSYAFQLPPDFLRAMAAGQPDRGRGLVYRISGRRLECNADAVLLTYVYRPDESGFPPFFDLALIARLAAEFCLPLTESTTRAQLLHQLAEAEFRRAKTIDSQQDEPGRIEDFTLVEVRG